MVQRCVSDAKEVDIEVPAELMVGATTVAEVDGRFEKSCAKLVLSRGGNVTHRPVR